MDELYYNYEMRKIGIEELSGRGHAAATGRYESRGHAAASGRYAPAAGLAEKDSSAMKLFPPWPANISLPP